MMMFAIGNFGVLAAQAPVSVIEVVIGVIVFVFVLGFIIMLFAVIDIGTVKQPSEPVCEHEYEVRMITNYCQGCSQAATGVDNMSFSCTDQDLGYCEYSVYVCVKCGKER